MFEDRIYIAWPGGFFLTTQGNKDFQRQLAAMVKDLGRPDTVEFRAGDEGYIPGGDDFEDPDSATDIIPLRQHLEEVDSESSEC